MITGDDSRHRAALLLADPPPSEQLLRVPCRVESQGKVIEGEGVIDTGATLSCVRGEFEKTGEPDEAICYCGHMLSVHRFDAVLTVAGVTITKPICFPANQLGALALIGLDVLMQCRFTYEDGKFTLEKM